MKLIPNWRRVLRRAWSVKFLAAAAVFSGTEVALPYLGDTIAPGRLAALSALATAGAFVARFLFQKEMDNEQAR